MYWRISSFPELEHLSDEDRRVLVRQAADPRLGIRMIGRAAVLAPAMLIGYGASRFVAHFLDRGYVRPVVLSFSAVASVALLVTELFA